MFEYNEFAVKELGIPVLLYEKLDRKSKIYKNTKLAIINELRFVFRHVIPFTF